jgi:hypothetical protein
MKVERPAVPVKRSSAPNGGERRHRQHAGWPRKPRSGSGGSSSKFERTGRGLTRFHATVGAARFRDLMADVPDALDEIRSPDQRGVAEFHVLLGGDDFHAFLAELTEALESGSDPGAFWARTTLAKLAAPAGPRTPWRTRRPPALPWRT